MARSSIRDAALQLRQLFLLSPNPAPARIEKVVAKEEPQMLRNAIDVVDDGVNKPLTFQLKSIDCVHPYLRQRGIKEETTNAFGVGFFSGRGSMSGRVVIPIHNDRGELIAYAGRSIDATEPKYRLPAGFKKSVELFNLNRVLGLAEDHRRCVIVCEGFFDCMKVHQAGLPAVIALMGSTLSDVQQNVLQNFGRVILFLDGDEPGREASATIAARLTQHTFVRVVSLADGKQPDQLSSDELRSILGSF